MIEPRNQMSRSAGLQVALAVGMTALASAQEPTVRVRGVIDKNERWAGLVWITDDLTIEGADVSVEPGTTIEFAQTAENEHPVLSVGRLRGKTGRLLLEGTADRPVKIRTKPGTNRGRVELHAPVGPSRTADQDAAPIIWRHVVLEDLGFIAEARRTRMRVPDPSVKFHLGGMHGALEIKDCLFRNCSRVQVQAPPGAAVRIGGNRSIAPQDRVAIEVHLRPGTGSDIPPIEVFENHLAAGLVIRGLCAIVRENVLVGPDAAIILEDDDCRQTRIVGNYVHNTTAEDDGRYCLRCGNPAAVIERNILRGGTTGLLGGSRRISGNLLIGAPKLSSKRVKTARTHALVQGLPPGAVFEDNLLLGPAHSLLVPQLSITSPTAGAAGEPIVIRHNVFDGLGETNRAVQLNAPGAATASVRLYNNLFLRVACMIQDAARGENTLLYSDFNAVAPEAGGGQGPEGPGDKPGGGARPGAHDRHFSDIGGLKLSETPAEKIESFDEDVRSGRRTVEEVRRRIFSAYLPAADSPLRGGGRSDGGDSASARAAIGIRAAAAE